MKCTGGREQKTTLSSGKKVDYAVKLAGRNVGGVTGKTAGKEPIFSAGSIAQRKIDEVEEVDYENDIFSQVFMNSKPELYGWLDPCQIPKGKCTVWENAKGEKSVII